MAIDLPTSSAVTTGTVTNAQQKLNFGAMLDFLLGYLGAKFGDGPQTVASAATLDLEAVTDTRDVVISGTAAITSMTMATGKVFRFRASGAFTLTNNSAIVTNTGANIVCAAGDSFVARATATNTVEILSFVRAANAPGGANVPGIAPVFGCRAWVNFNGTGTVAINGSGNVSSVTDNGVGDYTINFAVAMPDTNYCPVFGQNVITAQSAAYQIGVYTNGIGSAPLLKSTTQLRIGSLRETTYDAYEVNVAIFR